MCRSANAHTVIPSTTFCHPERSRGISKQAQHDININLNINLITSVKNPHSKIYAVKTNEVNCKSEEAKSLPDFADLQTGFAYKLKRGG